MLIREQGRLIKLLRVVRKPTAGRPCHLLIGEFCRDADPPEALMARLDEAERKSLLLWLNCYRRQRLDEANPEAVRSGQLDRVF